jgi:hypothetical protein
MSFLTVAYAVPSRVIGVYRFLLHARGQRESLESLGDHLAPKSLPLRGERGADSEEGAGKDMVQKTVNECVTAGLLAHDGEDVCLHPNLSPKARDPRSGEAILPLTLAALCFSPTNDANHDLGLAIAWYLQLDVLRPPGSWPEVEQLLIQSGLDETLKLSDVRYHMLEDWLCYLGFGWAHVPGDRKLVPDPTVHLRCRLPELFPASAPARQPFPMVAERLASLCPVFEGGAIRTRLGADGLEATKRLSNSTALAWLRLRDEGDIELHHESDAEVLILPDGDQSQPVSHVTIIRRGEEG